MVLQAEMIKCRFDASSRVCVMIEYQQLASIEYALTFLVSQEHLHSVRSQGVLNQARIAVRLDCLFC